MNFVPFNAHTTSLFKNCNILKFVDIINVESCIFINNCFNAVEADCIGNLVKFID